jgi:hypothetical protein
MYDCPDNIASDRLAGKGKRGDFDLGKPFRRL